MRQLYLLLRAILLWTSSFVHFAVFVCVFIPLSIFIDPKKIDPAVRAFSRNIVRLAGARLEVRCSRGFDAGRTSFFIVNHVNLFDPFILYSAIPQHLRGLELESHFRIPVYGWLMKRFGNVPVPRETRPSDLKRMWRLTKAALDQGTSLAVFPEGGRTIDGHVGPFKSGVFRMAHQFGVPLVPVSLVGSFDFNRKTSWMLWPARVTVHIHDTIETRGMSKDECEALQERVREIISRPIEEWLRQRAKNKPESKA